MKATELRIGNYIYHPIHGMGKVSAISGSDILYDRNYDSLSIELMEGVPLTEEWLIGFDVLFGFNHCGSQYEVELAIIEYHLRLNYDVGMSKYIGEIKYVHQLQNLYYALTNEEIKIKETIETN